MLALLADHAIRFGLYLEGFVCVCVCKDKCNLTVTKFIHCYLCQL